MNGKLLSYPLVKQIIVLRSWSMGSYKRICHCGLAGNILV